MPISRLFVFALSLAAGGGAAWLATNGEPDVKQFAVTQTAEVEKVDILVAGVDLEQRRRLNAGDLVWQSWPKEALVEGYIRRSASPDAVDEIAGKLVRVSILQGEPLRMEKISEADYGYLSALLEPGRRAVSVKVTAESTAGGFILPEDRVDVLHTVVQSGSGGVTRTVVTNVRVLAVDQQIAAPESNAVSGAKTATLELDPQQAEIVSAAEATGALSLALRSSADNSDSQIVADDSARTILIFGRGQSRMAQTN